MKYWKSLREKVHKSYQNVVNDTTTLSALDHQLIRPDSNLGSIVRAPEDVYVYRDGQFYYEHMQYFSNAIYKLFDEVVTNVIDQKMRLEINNSNKHVTRLDVKFNPDKSFSVINNGSGMNIQKDPDGIYKIQKIFTEDHHSSNYDDTAIRYWVGRNGLGLKVISACCECLRVTSISAGKCYSQRFINNRSIIETPTVTDCNSADCVDIKFRPDYEYLDDVDETLFEYMKPVFIKRLYDIAMCFPDLEVFINDCKVIINVQDYVAMHTGTSTSFIVAVKIAEYRKNKFIIFPNNGRANGLRLTHIGGIPSKIRSMHDLTAQIEAHIVKTFHSKFYNKDDSEKLSITGLDKFISIISFVFIQNPAFASQGKKDLTNKASEYKYIWPVIPEDQIEFLMTNGLGRLVTDWAKGQKHVNDIKKITSLHVKLDTEKYAPANNARLDNDATMLFVSEGNSAKAPLTEAFPILGRAGYDNIGVYCFRGKIINANKKEQKATNNIVVAELMKIIGLEFGKKYTSRNELIYKRLVSITDADDDGIHIFSLIVGLIFKYWPELLKLNWIFKFRTPCVKISLSRSNEALNFYSIDNFKQWNKKNSDLKFTAKYIKGLGSNDAESFSGFLLNMKNNIIKIEYDSGATEMITMAMGKNVDVRKIFLKAYTPNLFIDYDKTLITYSEHFNDFHSQFMTYANFRSIPTLMDGLKLSQKKILWVLKRSKKKAHIQKVGILVGEILSKADYHHSDTSLSETIAHMAQNFVGAKNINLLLPEGAFGCRAEGTKVFASPRYISTGLNPIANLIFREEDSCILQHSLSDDNAPIEPTYYIGVIPMVLVNGANGIGYGYSTLIPQFCPKDIIKYIRAKLLFDKSIHFDNKNQLILKNTTAKDISISQWRHPELIPWYYGFTGKIEYNAEHKCYFAYGNYQMSNDGLMITVTELPPEKWTNVYTKWLRGHLGDPNGPAPHALKINKYDVKTSDRRVTGVRIEIYLDVPFDKSVDIIQALRLSRAINTTNMYLFDASLKLRKYEDQYAIIDDFIVERLKFYELRKNKIIELKKAIAHKYNSEYRYIYTIAIEKPIDIRGAGKEKLLECIRKIPDIYKDPSASGYEYLLGIPNKYLTIEHIEELKRKWQNMLAEIEILRATAIQDIWTSELDELEKAL